MTAFSEERVGETTVLVAGDGDPLVFLHGPWTMTGFDALLPLAERFRLVVPYHPGFGPSADDMAMDDVHDLRRHTLDVLDALGLDAVALVGHSMGGWLAANLAIDAPERVRRLVLAAPSGLRDQDLPAQDIFTLGLPDLLERLGVEGADLTPEYLADRYRESASAARLLWSKPYDIKLARWLHRATMPTMVVWGEADAMLPVGLATRWAELIPDAEVRTLPGVGHLLFDDSEEAVELVATFVGEELPV